MIIPSEAQHLVPQGVPTAVLGVTLALHTGRQELLTFKHFLLENNSPPIFNCQLKKIMLLFGCEGGVWRMKGPGGDQAQ